MFSRQVLAGLLLVSVSACVSAPFGALTASSPEEAKVAAVKQRAVARWEALIKRDLDAAYEYYSAASRRAIPKSQAGASLRIVTFRSVVVEKASCEAETCKVELVVTYDHKVMPGVPARITETWVIENGQAWFVHPI